ncbi:restriction endonuclease subunit S [Aquirufa sp. 5-AUSEE-100C1]
MNKVKLSSIIDIISGGTPKTDVKQYWENGTIGWLSVTDFNNDLRYVYSTEKKITVEGLNNSNTKLLRRGDIIISARGTVGALAQIGLPMCFNQSCFGIRGKKGIVETDYLFYALKNYVSNIKKRSQGSVFDTINLNSFDLMEIEISEDLNDQNKIAFVLSALDSKIELNNRINAELELMAKTIYDYWFVQFDFPNENGKPYKSSGGKMVWNEELKREIPKGWDVEKINSIVEVKDGTHDSPKPQSEGFRLITSKNLQVSGLDFENASLISEEDYLSIIKRSNVETGDILFSMIGNIGTVYKVEEKEINFTIKNVALYKTSQKEEYKNYVCMFLKSIDMNRYMKNVISGSIQKFIGLNRLREAPILSNEVYIKKYNGITSSIFEKLENIKLENQKLRELRDWLLPMLMTEQLKIYHD